jgi:hypothetical protein
VPADVQDRSEEKTRRSISYPLIESMDNSTETPTTITPDARAYAVLLLAFSPLAAIYAVLWGKRGTIPFSVTMVVVGLVVVALLQLKSRTVTLGEQEMVQGWPPLGSRIAYHEIRRIHHRFVSSRYGSSPCLAISAGPKGKEKEILLPLRPFNLAKRVRLVEWLKVKAPQARVDADS